MIEGLLQSGLPMVKSMHRVDAFGNSPGLCRKLAEGIGSLPGWRKGVRQKKIETHWKIIRWDLARSSLGDSPKESGSSLGMRREIARKKTRGLAVRLSEVAGICGSKPTADLGGGQLLTVGKLPRSTGKLPVPHNLGGGQLLTMGKLPKLAGKPPVPGLSGYGWILAPILKPIWGL
ncbi:hypothetical protein GW17_00030308 [Ensete ventricosum]|nr:hypothetical protein GW17_00030308 [Ensete ventricosum]